MLYVYTKTPELLQNKEFKEKWGDIYKFLSLKRNGALYFMAYLYLEKLFFFCAALFVKSLPIQVFMLYFHNLFCMIYLGLVKPFISKFDNQIELFNTWANGNILIMIITIGGVTPDIKIQNNMGNVIIIQIGIFFGVNLIIIFWFLT